MKTKFSKICFETSTEILQKFTFLFFIYFPESKDFQKNPDFSSLKDETGHFFALTLELQISKNNQVKREKAAKSFFVNFL